VVKEYFNSTYFKTDIAKEIGKARKAWERVPALVCKKKLEY